MPKSKFFRIAVEGGTTDGRVIEREWLEQMAADYNPATYAARVNMEHIRGFSPEPPFNAYGDVTALKTEEVDIELGGKTEKRLALFAEIDATDGLVEINRKKQKLFTSCEISPNFAGKGRAYLVGLAVTDSPASLGTEMLAFAAGQGDNSPLASRKQDSNNVFSAANENELALDLEEAAAEPVGELKGIVATFAGLVAKLTGTVPTPEPTPAPEPQQPANDNLASLAATFAQLATSVEKSASETAANVTALSDKVDELAARVDTTPEKLTRRPLASGGNGSVRTDC